MTDGPSPARSWRGHFCVQGLPGCRDADHDGAETPGALQRARGADRLGAVGEVAAHGAQRDVQPLGDLLARGAFGAHADGLLGPPLGMLTRGGGTSSAAFSGQRAGSLRLLRGGVRGPSVPPQDRERGTSPARRAYGAYLR